MYEQPPFCRRSPFEVNLKKYIFLLPMAQYEINPNSTEVHVILSYFRVGGQGVTGVDQIVIRNGTQTFRFMLPCFTTELQRTRC